MRLSHTLRNTDIKSGNRLTVNRAISLFDRAIVVRVSRDRPKLHLHRAL